MGGRQKAFLEHEEVMDLLRSEIARAGGQGRWAKMIGMDRTQLNKMMHGPQLLSERVIKALKLRDRDASATEARRSRWAISAHTVSDVC
jgi:hypothetical protein